MEKQGICCDFVIRYRYDLFIYDFGFMVGIK